MCINSARIFRITTPKASTTQIHSAVASGYSSSPPWRQSYLFSSPPWRQSSQPELETIPSTSYSPPVSHPPKLPPAQPKITLATSLGHHRGAHTIIKRGYHVGLKLTLKKNSNLRLSRRRKKSITSLNQR